MRRWLVSVALALSVALTGCASVLPVLADVLTVVEDAGRILDVIRSAEVVWFMQHPDKDAQAKVENAIAKASLALDAALRTTRGASSLSKDDSVAAFSDFQAAYAELEMLLKQTGIVGLDGRMGVRYGSIERVSFPRPLAMP